jgi:hypothetical protein
MIELELAFVECPAVRDQRGRVGDPGRENAGSCFSSFD